MRNVFKYRKILIILILGMLIFSGCGGENKKVIANKGPKEKVTIVTSFYPIFIFTSNIVAGIDNVELINLANNSTGCLHDYNLTSNNMKTLENADVLVINGLGMETFIERVVKDFPKLKIVEASKGITPISENGVINPHVWVSVGGAIEEVKKIGDGLGSIDIKNKDKYAENTQSYVKRLEVLNKKMKENLKKIEGSNIVTFHEAFPYFARDYGLNIATVIESEPGVEPAAASIKESIKVIKEKNIKALFVEPQYSPTAANTISKETGAKIYSLDPIVMPISSAKVFDTYETIMEHNMYVLLEALK